MSNNKQNHIGDANKMVTAVEWLVSQQKHNKLFDIETIEQAKAMHKEEIMDAYHINPLESKWQNEGIKYYNENFKSE